MDIEKGDVVRVEWSDREMVVNGVTPPMPEVLHGIGGCWVSAFSEDMLMSAYRPIGEFTLVRKAAAEARAGVTT